MKRTFWCGSFALLLIWGCGGSSSTTVLSPDPVVGFVNASSNSVAIDALLNEGQLANNVAFRGFGPKAGNVLTFSSFEPGDYDLLVQENGIDETQAVEVGNTQRDKSYILFAVGLVTPPNDEVEKMMRPVLAEINRTKPNGDKAQLMIVHAYNRAPGFETPAIDFQNPGDNPIVREANIPFSTTKQTLIDAGDQTFVARRSGSEFDVTPPVTFTFEGGKIYVALVGGVEDAVGAEAPGITFIEVQTK